MDFTLTTNSAASDAAGRWRKDHPHGTVEEALEALPAPEFAPNWFSDGGICSNLPVHFFDRALPSRPTFAIDLTVFPPGRTRSVNEAENSYLPAVNQAGAHRRWAPWAPEGLAALTGFGRAVVDSARVWVDEAQLVMPGFRDRVVTIFHDETEGGMNLSMPPEVLKRLVDRGAEAAAKLVEQFAGSPPFQTPGKGWDNHRWIRFRTATSGLEAWLADFRGGYTSADPRQSSTRPGRTRRRTPHSRRTRSSALGAPCSTCSVPERPPGPVAWRFRAAQAIRRYSLITPPRTRFRRIGASSGMTVAGSWFGGRWSRPWCGR